MSKTDIDLGILLDAMMNLQQQIIAIAKVASPEDGYFIRDIPMLDELKKDFSVQYQTLREQERCEL